MRVIQLHAGYVCGVNRRRRSERHLTNVFILVRLKLWKSRPLGESPLRKVCGLVSAPLLLAVLVVCGVQAAIAQMSDRVQAIESQNMAPLAGSLHPMARSEFDRGLTDNSKVLSGMSINFKRSDAQEASLNALLAAQQTPGSASYHKWLTPTQFGQQFGMSSADIARVSDWLRSEGFTVTGVAQSANSISFSGPVSAVERAFQTEIHNYVVNGQT